MADFGLIRSPLFAQFGLTALFTERHKGASPPPFDSLNFGFGLGDPETNIRQNFATLCSEASLPRMPHTARQVHAAATLWCSGDGFDHTDEADILLTDQPGCAVAVRTADCLPLLLADPDKGIAAAVHAGWRGTVADASGTAVEAMVQAGASREGIIAALGPCIGSCCFETGEDVASQLADCVGNGATAVHRNPQPHVDLSAINTMQLLAAGLRFDHIEVHNICTCCHPRRFFSYRRDAERTGRHLGVVAVGSPA